MARWHDADRSCRAVVRRAVVVVPLRREVEVNMNSELAGHSSLF